MKLCVYGLWHLGSVTAACMADLGFDTVGLDPSNETTANLGRAIPPLYEPGLAELVQSGLSAGKLSFTSEVETAVAGADVVWVSFDTPVDDEDCADVAYVKTCVAKLFPYLRDGAVVLISSQMPVGNVARLEEEFERCAGGRTVHFACSPENLRLGKAIDIFKNPGRIVIGIRGSAARAVLEPMLSMICRELIWISVESAEMTKHAINAFLATCVTYINEIATVCEEVGADAAEVERAIRSDPRIGTKTYVSPGAAFAGGTLARDVVFLNQIADSKGLTLSMLGGIIDSNAKHRRWALRRLEQLVTPLAGAQVAVLGLSYKPGTDAVRRSVAVELCRAIRDKGAAIKVFDPAVVSPPSDLAGAVQMTTSLEEALKGASAAIIATEWPEFRDLTAADVTAWMQRPLFLDASRFLAAKLRGQPGVQYVTVGTVS